MSKHQTRWHWSRTSLFLPTISLSMTHAIAHEPPNSNLTSPTNWVLSFIACLYTYSPPKYLFFTGLEAVGIGGVECCDINSYPLPRLRGGLPFETLCALNIFVIRMYFNPEKAIHPYIRQHWWKYCICYNQHQQPSTWRRRAVVLSSGSSKGCQ